MQQILDRLEQLHFLVIGDVMIDSYIWGKVDRISPEAPVPVFSVQKREYRMGGAANVALNTTSLGIRTTLCGVIGNDPKGDTLLDLLEKEHILDEGIVKVQDRPTTTKTRIIAHSQHVLRVDEESTEYIEDPCQQKFFTKIERIIDNDEIDAIIFEDYDKGLLSPWLIEKIITKAKEKGIITVVDPKKRNFLTYKNVTLFKPNLKELKEGLKIEFDARNFDQLRNAAKQLRKLINAEYIMITLSEMGVYISSPDDDQVIPAHIRSIADVSGAGDTVVSVVAAFLALEAGATTAAQIGNLAGGLVCEKVGVVPIDQKLLFEEIANNNISISTK